MIVVCALINKDNKYLIAKRSTGNPEVMGKWEFPGGKVELNEREEDAIEREIKEEFDLIIKAKSYITSSILNNPNKYIELKMYECDYIDGIFNLHDHSEYKFVNKEDIINYDLAPLDIPLALYINKYIN